MADKTTTEQSVEEALNELREMFPDAWLSIQITQRRDYDDRERVVQNYFIGVDGTPSGALPTLNEAMAQVRAWHAEQAKES